MAIFPCDLCRKRYPGRSNSVYIGWMAGGFSDRQKLNVCPWHADKVQEWISKNLTCIERGGVSQTDDVEVARTCEVCGLEATAQTWFANTYIRSEDPAVWVRGVCEKCAGQLRQDMPVAA